MRNTNKTFGLTTTSAWKNGTWRVWGDGGTRELIDITDAPNPEIIRGIRITIDSTPTDSYSQCFIPLVSGCEYTLSCYVRLVSGDGRGYILPYNDIGGVAISTKMYVSTDVWQRISCTFKAVGSTSVLFANSSAPGVIDICGEKLEVGNKATDWCPSPWDMVSRADYNALADRVAALEAK